MGTSACADAAELVDRIVAGTVRAAVDLRDEVEELAQLAFMKATDHHNVHGHVSSNMVIYDPSDTILPRKFHFQDTQMTDTIQPDDRCNRGRF